MIVLKGLIEDTYLHRIYDAKTLEWLSIWVDNCHKWAFKKKCIQKADALNKIWNRNIKS